MSDKTNLEHNIQDLMKAYESNVSKAWSLAEEVVFKIEDYRWVNFKNVQAFCDDASFREDGIRHETEKLESAVAHLENAARLLSVIDNKGRQLRGESH